MTAEQWVDVTVHEMQAATDVGDARRRAQRLLQAFELVARKRAEEANAGEMETLRRTAADLARDNAVLKRAVTIQNQRVLEAQQRETELAQLRHLVGKYREELSALEMSNYSLSVHLRTAFSPEANDRRPPDVF